MGNANRAGSDAETTGRKRHVSLVEMLTPHQQNIVKETLEFIREHLQDLGLIVFIR